MKLYELASVITSDYIIIVNKGAEVIEKFESCYAPKRTKYRNAIVKYVYISDESVLTINVEIE